MYSLHLSHTLDAAGGMPVAATYTCQNDALVPCLVEILSSWCCDITIILLNIYYIHVSKLEVDKLY